ETARLNTHILSLSRIPKAGAMIGNYEIGHVNNVALCPPMLMVYGEASEVFKHSEQYNPERFLKRSSGSSKDEESKVRNESYGASHLITWGAGLHLCPGKM